jgi:hypothetical protein
MSEGDKYNTYKEALDAVKYRSHSLKHVRPDLQTPELALIAVKKLGLNLKYVPAHLQTSKVIETALKKDPKAKEFIKVKEMFKNALEEALGE